MIVVIGGINFIDRFGGVYGRVMDSSKVENKENQDTTSMYCRWFAQDKS